MVWAYLVVRVSGGQPCAQPLTAPWGEGSSAVSSSRRMPCNGSPLRQQPLTLECQPSQYDHPGRVPALTQRTRPSTEPTKAGDCLEVQISRIGTLAADTSWTNAKRRPTQEWSTHELAGTARRHGTRLQRQREGSDRRDNPETSKPSGRVMNPVSSG